jgi:cell division topological specificity factor
VFDFFNRFFGAPASSQTAKERLRLVLLSDHLSLAPDVVENLKHDLLEVISRYVEVDVANCDVTFEQREKEVAMLANIPILGMQKRTPPPAPPAPPSPPQETAPSFDAAGASASVATPPEPAAAPKPARKPSSAGNGTGTTRRRRRKATAPAGLQGSPQPT